MQQVGLGFRVLGGVGFRVQGLGFRVLGVGVRVLGSVLTAKCFSKWCSERASGFSRKAQLDPS